MVDNKWLIGTGIAGITAVIAFAGVPVERIAPIAKTVAGIAILVGVICLCNYFRQLYVAKKLERRKQKLVDDLFRDAPAAGTAPDKQTEQAIRTAVDDVAVKQPDAFRLLWQGKRDEALTMLKQRARSAQDWYDLAMLVTFSHPQQSQQYLETAVKLDANFYEAHNQLAILLTRFGQVGEAIAIWEALQQQTATNQQARGAVLGNLGNAYSSLGDYRKAIDYYKQALTIAHDISNKQMEGRTLGNLGIAYDKLGDHRKAISYYTQALTIARNISDKQGEGNHLGNLGLAYDMLGDYRTAIDYFEQALTIARAISDKQGEGNRLGNLGIAYDELGDYQKAIDYHQQALAIAHDLNDKRGKGNHLGNLGSAYLQLGHYRKAIDYYEQALAISRAIGDKQGEGNRLGNLGNVYAALGDTATASDYLQQAYDIFVAIESPYAARAKALLDELNNG